MAKAAKTRYFSLRTDVEPLLKERLLWPGERLLNFRPINGDDTSPGLQGFSPPLTGGQRLLKVLGYVGIGLLFVLIFPILIYALEGVGSSSKDDGRDSRRRRPIYAWGDGAASAAAKAVLPTMQRTGVWVVTDKRLVFVALNGRFTALAPHQTGEAGREPGPIEVETVVEMVAGRFAYQGQVERTRTTWLRREKPIGPYHRIAFPDGSGIDVRHRYSPANDPMARFGR
ncbi:hypothetical protein [Glycomyces harbinensis]|uniref:Uncharacterized protein n=1 Tax=Glycomyces harbinensis TaxID=58114 RepID=A0A1G6V3N9_9ACTN|nr:hypothetical protein [Glycomyces harbinensis]SDD48148.1 hypothetical protein SAMN05216270_104185 [Glycomyces harbinensis]